MAIKQGVSYTRNKIDKAELKGVLNVDAMTITYETKDDGVVTVQVAPYLEQFDSQLVSLCITTKIDEELQLPEDDDE